MGGPSGPTAFADTFLGMALTGAAFRPFEGLFGDAAVLERELQTWAGTAKTGAKLAVKAPLEVGVGIGAAGAAHAITHGGQAEGTSADEVVTQGIAFVATKLVHRHTLQLRERLTRAVSGADRAEAEALARQLEALSLRSQAAGSRPPLEEARALLAEHAALLAHAAALCAKAPGKAGAAARAQNAADQAALGGSFVEVSFRLAGLQPVVAGAIFEGTAAQIADALATARRNGTVLTEAHDTRSGVRRVTSGDRAYELRELAASSSHGAPQVGRGGAALTQPARSRSTAELTRLREQLPVELRSEVPIVESEQLAGSGVHVEYHDGRVRIVVGPDAEPRHVKYHVEAARTLLKFQGPLGFIRRLLNKIASKLTGSPGYGTAGFEANLEVKKLKAIEADLQATRARLDLRALALSNGAEAVGVDRELAEVQEQLEEHAGRVDSAHPGRGFVAAEGKGRGLPEYPISKALIEPKFDETDPRELECVFTGKTENGKDVNLGRVAVKLTPDGHPAGRPDMFLEASAFIDGQEYAAHIYDEVVSTAGSPPAGKGSRIPLTRYALDTFGRLYEGRFRRPLNEWGGSLAFSNKLHFQREYVRLRREGLHEPELSLAAVKSISYGIHRMDAGFTQLSVTTTPPEPVNLGEGYGVQRVPTHIEVIARKP